MDPTQLLGPTNSLGLPAPFWFIEFFKVLGFSLHVVPMNLWYAGVILAAILGVWGGTNGKRLAQRLMAQMPFIIAFGVNLGIVPCSSPRSHTIGSSTRDDPHCIAVAQRHRILAGAYYGSIFTRFNCVNRMSPGWGARLAG
jgi:hypothetical protein